VAAAATAPRSGDRGKTLTMLPEPVRISLADGLDTADNDLLWLLRPLKADAPVEGQVFLGRIADLQHVALEPGGGKAGDYRIDCVERRQKVTDQDELAGARQRLECRQTVRLRRIATNQLGDPCQRDATVHRRDAAAEQRQALAAADEKARESDEQKFRPIAFSRPFGTRQIIRRAVLHRGRGVAPQPDALCGLPLGFADIES